MNTIIKKLYSTLFLLVLPFHVLAEDTTWIFEKIFRFKNDAIEYTDLNQIINYLEQKPIRIENDMVYIGDSCSYSYLIDDSYKNNAFIANENDEEILLNKFLISEKKSESALITNSMNNTNCDDKILKIFGTFYKFDNKLLFKYNNHLFSYTLGNYIPSNRYNKDDIAILPIKYPYLCAHGLIKKTGSWCETNKRALLHKTFYNPLNSMVISVIKIVDPIDDNAPKQEYIVAIEDNFGNIHKIFAFRNHGAKMDFYYKN